MPESLPARASDGGPDREDRRDWRDWLYQAEEASARARRAMTATSVPDAAGEFRNALRLRHISEAMEALQQAKELLCR
jgi:hypothetical protein